MQHSALQDLESLFLKAGNHGRREDGVCLLEAVAWYAGETHTDHPACVCPGLTAMGISLNDAMGSDLRQSLKRLIPTLAAKGKSDHTLLVRRAFFLAEKACTVFAANALDSAGLPDEASKLRALRINDVESAGAARSAAVAASYELAIQVFEQCIMLADGGAAN